MTLPPDYATRFLGQPVTVHVDRPLGSRHPRWGFVYPVNYGAIPGAPAPDGEDVDAYILGLTEPVATATGVCIAVIQRRDDADDKLIVAPPGRDFTDAEICALTAFQEAGFASRIVRP